MASFVSYFLNSLAALLAIPVTIFIIEIVAALVLPSRKNLPEAKSEIRRRVAVLVPAHNESLGIAPTLQDIKMQLVAGDRLLVVADNCTDDTAKVAVAIGAETIQRSDAVKIGKGYALDFGLQYLSRDAPSVLIIIDADCRVRKGTIDRLAATCLANTRPVQALDLMIAADTSPINYRVAEFAWRVKNWVRPLGLNALNLPCQLMGTGMAFPWEVIRSANLATGSIVEDIKLGLDLAQAGKSPLFCPSAVVTSKFPLSIEGAKAQRRRWEEGHVSTIFATLPRFIYQAIARRNFNLLVLSLDLAVPPLSLLILLLIGTNIVAWIGVFCGVSSAAPLIGGFCIIAMASAILLAWVKYGRDILSLSAMHSIVSYIVAKLPIYRQLFSSRAASSWTRTEREKNE